MESELRGGCADSSADNVFDRSIDVRRLAKYLPLHIDGFWGLDTAIKFSGGQSNPTSLLKAGSGRYVLRRKPYGSLLSSAHAIDREYRLLEALESTAVPVAKPLHYCTDTSVIGSEFYIMQHVEGRIFWNQALPDQSAVERSAMFDEMNKCLAAIHSVDFDAVGLRDFGRMANYYPRQLSRWTCQYRASQTAFYPDVEHLLNWLKDNMIPDDGEVSLTHGDYRMDNLIWHPEKPEILAVIDWELATVGHPLADLAYQCMVWSQPANELSRGLAGIDRSACGIPTDQQYVETYYKRIGIDAVEEWNFHLAFAYFRIAAILQGVAKRGRQGNPSSDQAVYYGTKVPVLARQGLAIALGKDRSTDAPTEEMVVLGEPIAASGGPI